MEPCLVHITGSTLIVANGNSYTTPSLALGSHTYYVEARTCTNSATRLSITVNVDACLGSGEIKSGEDLQVSVYPNPFNGSAVLESNYKFDHAEVDIYNLMGEKVQTLTAGQGSNIFLERGNLSSGIYYYKLRDALRIKAAGNFVISE